jgi:hypothetical protein
MVSIFDKRPPYVRFEEREMGIDPVASDKAGRPVPRVVILACITNAGSKDVHEAIAEEWLQKIRMLALKNEYPLEWSQHFRAAFEEWKKGNELPREGTPVKTWQMVTREQANVPMLSCAENSSHSALSSRVVRSAAPGAHVRTLSRMRRE